MKTLLKYNNFCNPYELRFTLTSKATTKKESIQIQFFASIYLEIGPITTLEPIDS